MQHKPSTLRRASGMILAAFMALSWFSPTQQALRELPGQLALTQGQSVTLQLGGLQASGDALTVTASRDERLAAAGSVDVVAGNAGATELLLSLFGLPLRRVEVEVSPEKRLIPGGQALGVAMRTEGVLVVGVSDVASGESPARNSGLQAGDVITTVDGVAIATARELSERVSAAGAQ
ncbi:MAG: PDZ domain-containing protein, partial [Clostridia bacterium]|nr:PDZ domain-containing protein [Clostridia bacterium]